MPPRRTTRKKAPTAKQLHAKKTLKRVNKELEKVSPPKKRTKKVVIEITDDEENENDDDNALPATPVPPPKKPSKTPAKRVSPLKLKLNFSASKVDQPPSSPPPIIYDINLVLYLLINGKPKATPTHEKVTRDSFKLDTVWSVFEPHFRRETEPVEPISQLLYCSIRCIAKTVRKTSKVLHDWSLSSTEVLLATMDEKFAEKPSNFELVIEFKVDINLAERIKLIKAATISSPGSAAYDEPSALTDLTGFSRRAGTIAQERNARIALAADVGGPTKRLMRKWACNESECNNINNYCFVEPPPGCHYYPLTDGDFEKWVVAIGLGRATDEEPSLALFKQWVTSKSANGHLRDAERAGQRATSKDVLRSVNRLSSGVDKITALQERQLERQLMRDAAEDEREARRQDKIERRRRRKEESDEEREEEVRRLRKRRELERRELERRREIVILPSLLPSQLSRQSRPTASGMDRLQGSPLKRASSPIRPGEDDTNVIQEVFEWKKKRIEDERGVERWTEAYLKVVENQWTIKDLKAMSLGKGVFFEEGIDAGIPRPMMRQFKEVFDKFKRLFPARK